MTADALTRHLLVGTARRATLPALPPGPLADAIAALPDNDPAARLLDALALSTPYADCGRTPAVDTLPPPTPADDDPRPPCSDRASDLLHTLLLSSGTNWQHALMAEWLAYAAAAGQRPPDWTLADLLMYAATHKPLRKAAAAATGTRGRWVHAQFGGYGGAFPPDDATVWSTGFPAHRNDLLERVRRENPAAGLAMVQSTWAEDPAEHRSAFVALLRHGLSLADEPFLEAALDDRAAAVRTAAAEELSRLSGSALVRRTIERIDPLLAFVPKSRSGKSYDEIRVTLPAAFDPAWQRDGLRNSGPNAGAPQDWVRQMVERVPPGHWCARWGVSAADVHGAIGDCYETLSAAWPGAVARHPDAAWLKLLLATKPAEVLRLREALLTLPPDVIDDVAATTLAAPRPPAAVIEAVLSHRPFGPRTTAAAIELIGRIGVEEDWPQRGPFKSIQVTVALGLPPEALDAFTAAYPEGTPARQSLDWLMEVLDLRLQIKKEFAP